MQYVVNFTSMQYMSTLVNTGAEGTLSTIVTSGIKTACRLQSPVVPKELLWTKQQTATTRTTKGRNS